jgi:hypothetical protein
MYHILLLFFEEILIFNFEIKVPDTSKGTPLFNLATYEITLVCKEPTCTTSASIQEIQNSYPTYSAVIFLTTIAGIASADLWKGICWKPQ